MNGTSRGQQCNNINGIPVALKLEMIIDERKALYYLLLVAVVAAAILPCGPTVGLSDNEGTSAMRCVPLLSSNRPLPSLQKVFIDQTKRTRRSNDGQWRAHGHCLVFLISAASGTSRLQCVTFGLAITWTDARIGLIKQLHRDWSNRWSTSVRVKRLIGGRL